MRHFSIVSISTQLAAIGLILGIGNSTLADEKISVANAPPVIVRTVPVAGQEDVDPSIREIRATFSKQMQDKSWSWTQISDESFPESDGEPRYLSDRKTCVLPVKLKPNTTYVLWLNSTKFKNFKDTGERAAIPYLLAFHTAKQSKASAPRKREPSEGTISKGTVELTHVDDTSESKSSIAGSGHIVEFTRSPQPKHIVAVQMFGSRYGMPRAPSEDFSVYFLDENEKLIKELKYPYSLIERGDERWYTLEVPDVEVPEKFFVVFSFNPHQAKGIYMGMDKDVAQTHSSTGLPGRPFRQLSQKSDWMIRVHLDVPKTPRKR